MRTSLKYLFLLLIVGGSFGCKTKDPCTWSTAKDLATSDLKKCNADSSFYLMRKFSLDMNPLRKEKGIPLLPEDFHGIVYTVNYQVRWANWKVIDDTTYKGGYFQSKVLEWRGDTLKYDISNFKMNDSLDTWVAITYYQDTINHSPDYKLMYNYQNKYIPDSVITKRQADSIINSFNVFY